VIETEDEYDRFLVVAEKLMHKRLNRTTEETALLMLVVKLIEDYESIHHNLDETGWFHTRKEKTSSTWLAHKRKA
jgi:HTH-type transcriptional regulator / antitoxin HigA